MFDYLKMASVRSAQTIGAAASEYLARPALAREEEGQAAASSKSRERAVAFAKSSGLSPKRERRRTSVGR
jgi:hypothetical protein